jgi:hypothetical protein
MKHQVCAHYIPTLDTWIAVDEIDRSVFPPLFRTEITAAAFALHVVCEREAHVFDNEEELCRAAVRIDRFLNLVNELGDMGDAGIFTPQRFLNAFYLLDNPKLLAQVAGC